MKPPAHAAISLAIGGVLWAATKSPYSAVAALATGVLVDLDHLLEYYRWFVKEDHSRVVYFLHSYELVVPALLAGYLSGWDPLILGVSMAFIGHLLTDQIANPVQPFAYFFTYRALKRFKRNDIVDIAWPDLERDFLGSSMARKALRVLNPNLKTPEARESQQRPPT